MRNIYVISLLFACRNTKDIYPTIETDTVIDSDRDGLTDEEEERLGSDPLNPDSDGDGIIDGADPDLINVDSDRDGLTDQEEEELGTDPQNPDSDGDGIIDGADPDSRPSGDWDWEDHPNTPPDGGYPDQEYGNVPSDDDILSGSCCYEIAMYDRMGDGWNGAFLIISTQNESAIYAAQAGTQQDRATVCLDNGNIFVAQYSAGSWDEENRYTITNPSGLEVFSDGPYPQQGEVHAEDVYCDTNTLPPDDSDPTTDPNTDPNTDPTSQDDLWDWGEPSYSDSYEGTYDTYFTLYNSVTGFIVCENYVSVSIDANQQLSDTISCTTSNGQTLSFDLSGSIQTYGSYPSSGYSYGYMQGSVDMTVPSGDVFSTYLSGECYTGSYRSLYVYWTQEIQTPNGSRTYSGYLYNWN